MGVGQAIAIWIIEISLLGIGLVWGYKSGKAATLVSPVPNRQRMHAVEISRVRDEYKAYRDEVNHQFTDINNAVRDLNRAYGVLYQHMAEGSKRLVKEGEVQDFALSADQEFMATMRGLARQSSDPDAGAEVRDREKATAVVE